MIRLEDSAGLFYFLLEMPEQQLLANDFAQTAGVFFEGGFWILKDFVLFVQFFWKLFCIFPVVQEFLKVDPFLIVQNVDAPIR